MNKLIQGRFATKNQIIGELLKALKHLDILMEAYSECNPLLNSKPKIRSNNITLDCQPIRGMFDNYRDFKHWASIQLAKDKCGQPSKTNGFKPISKEEMQDKIDRMSGI